MESSADFEEGDVREREYWEEDWEDDGLVEFGAESNEEPTETAKSESSKSISPHPPREISPIVETPRLLAKEFHLKRAIELVKPLLTQPGQPGLGFPQNKNLSVWLNGYVSAIRQVLRLFQQEEEREERSKLG